MRRIVLMCLGMAVLAGCASATPTRVVVPTQVRQATQVDRATDVPTVKSSATRAIPTRTRANTPTTVPRATVAAPTAAAVEATASQTAVLASNDPVLVGAGDIAVCETKGDEATAALLDRIEGTVFTLGDNAYPNGTQQQFQDCYEPSWGRYKARTRPAAGNHDYNTAGGAGYFTYFGASAGDPKRGYYSYDVGAWHIVVLNSEVDARPDSPQIAWLRDDLAEHPTKCTLAMFHRPLFSSGPHGRDGSGDVTKTFWDVLYENGVELILNGHDHDYERFAPQDPNGRADAARGIREIVAGTGGGPPYVFGEIKPNSEARRVAQLGVLKLTLRAASYDWEFVPVAGPLFRDAGRGECR